VAGEFAGELRQRSLLRGSVIFSIAADGYVAAMAGAVWLPTFLGRTIALSLAPLAITIHGRSAVTSPIRAARGSKGVEARGVEPLS
jgi:hypothetical protein